MKKLLTETEVMDLIPNRYPIIYIDYVDEIESGKRLSQRKMSPSTKTFSKDISQEIQ